MAVDNANTAVAAKANVNAVAVAVLLLWRLPMPKLLPCTGMPAEVCMHTMPAQVCMRSSLLRFAPPNKGEGHLKANNVTFTAHLSS